MNGKHDNGYKKLFSNPVIVKELLLSFVTEAWIKDLDYDTLERIDKRFITPLSALRAPFPMVKWGKDNYITFLLTLPAPSWTPPSLAGGGEYFYTDER